MLPLVQAELRVTEAKQELLNNKTGVETASNNDKKQALCHLVKKVNTKLGKTESDTLTVLTNNEDC